MCFLLSPQSSSFALRDRPSHASKRRGKGQVQCSVKRTFIRTAVGTVLVIEKSVPNLNVIGPQVRKLREAKGWTQDELAAKLQLFGWDTSRVSVTKLETRSRRVPDLELFILGKVLGVSTDELFPHNLFGKMKELWPRYRVKLSRGQVPPA